jgi:hypothetical protein
MSDLNFKSYYFLENIFFTDYFRSRKFVLDMQTVSYKVKIIIVLLHRIKRPKIQGRLRGPCIISHMQSRWSFAPQIRWHIETY